MTITWYGHSCFKVANQGGHLTIITDPFDKNIGLTPPRGNVDIVTISHEHLDHNNIKNIAGHPFIINGPGEYEIKGTSILGLATSHETDKNQDSSLNTIYLIEMDGIRLCHLGDLGQSLSDNQLEAIGQVDVLIIPVGGHSTIDAAKAVTVVEQIEPHLVIPMHYKLPELKDDLDGVDKFLKEMGAGKKETVDRLTLKKKDLSSKEMEVIVMKN